MNQQATMARRPKLGISANTLSFFHLRNPWVVALWSIIFPGFGHFSCGCKVKGAFLILGELAINYKAHLNLAILYSLTGSFQQAKDVLDTQWLIIYGPVLLYAVFDSHRLAVEGNKLSILADRERACMTPTAISPIAFVTLDKRDPRLGILWSMFLPGLGHLFAHRVATSTFLLLVGVGMIVLSHTLQAIIFTALGDFQQAKTILDWQWLLNLPSFYGYAAWDAHTELVEINKLFEIEQARYFRDRFQNRPFFRLPFMETEV